jgi:hypothetical protein
MTLPIKRKWKLINQNVKLSMLAVLGNLPVSESNPLVITLDEERRNLDQNAKFHALCEDLAKSGYQWACKERTAEQWKVLLVSGHAMATKQGAEMVPGIEGEFVNLRESTARMSKARSSSLIEYTLAFCASNNIKLTDERIAA